VPISTGETKMLLKMLACTKPILSKVKGSAFDVGASMALLADVVIAEEGAVFCDARVSLGGTGESSVHIWTTLLGYHKAKEYLFSGKLLSAEEAMNLGVVNYCVNSEDIQSVVVEKTKLFAQLSPEAVRRTKLSVNAVLTQLIYKDLGTTPFKNTLIVESEEHFEASRAYLEKCQGNHREH
jgi:enoyl-CoA hydratase